MANTQRNTRSEFRSVVRNILFVFLAVVLFLMKRQYSGPGQELVHAYGGNLTVSFALYFVFLKLCMMLPRYGRLVAAAVVLACVECFEVFNGFGFMANTFDPYDLLANVIGIAIALGLDAMLSQYHSEKSSTTSP